MRRLARQTPPRSRFPTQQGWVIGLTLLGLPLFPARGDDFFAPLRPYLDTHCVKCHGGEKTEGKLDFRRFESERDLAASQRVWEEIAAQIESGDMPPKKPLPSAEENGHAVAWIRGRLGSIDWAALRSPGRVTLPRLTRAEYRNTLRDLLGVDLRAGEDLPEDGEGPSGFVNDRDALALSPAAMELYFDAAASALDGAFALARKPGIWRFEAEEMTRTAPRAADVAVSA